MVDRSACCSAQIIGDGGEIGVEAASFKSAIAHSDEAVWSALDLTEGAFDSGADFTM
nr:hypothetical protein [Novosphingobium sp. AAP83]